MHSFEVLGVLPIFIKRLSERGITEPTEVQKKIIPLLNDNKKLIFSSPTGTGKTFAYLLPFLGQLYKKNDEHPLKDLNILICAPTYELCSQIKGEADFLLKETGVKTVLLIGQANLSRQLEELKKASVIIGNPGRILLLHRMGKLKLKNLSFVVLDEGDRLVSNELLNETWELINLIKQKTDFLLTSCSATFPEKSQELLLPMLGEEVIIHKSNGNILKEKIEHWAIYSEEREKIQTLRSLINALNPGNRKKSFKALVFTARGKDVGKLMFQLQQRGLKASGLWGEMKKGTRKQSLDDFRSGRVNLLVTSDLAARGLDISMISHIIALDLGEDPNIYIHRAGRTARAGRKGIMITIGHEAEMRRLAILEKKLNITVYPKELQWGKILSPQF